jgi:hypothetical protein
MRRPSRVVVAVAAAIAAAVAAVAVVAIDRAPETPSAPHVSGPLGLSNPGSVNVFVGSTPAAGQTTNCSPTSANTMTNTVSHLCGFADTTNAGIPSGTTLYRVPEDITAPTAATGSGWSYDSANTNIRADVDGAVIKNITTTASISADTVNNVTVENCRVQFPGEWFAVTTRHTANFTLQHCELSGTNNSTGRMLAGFKDIYTDSTNLKVQYNNLYWVGTGIQMDGGLIKGNYIHDMGIVTGDHINGTTSNGGQSCTLLTIQDNTSLNNFDQTDAISLFEDFSTQCNRVIDHNLVAGGTYCIYGGQNSGGAAAHDIAITNNHFSRLFYSTCGQFGTVAAWPLDGTGGTSSGNVWDDTGAAVTL